VISPTRLEPFGLKRLVDRSCCRENQFRSYNRHFRIAARMTDIVDLQKARQDKKARRGYRNWAKRFKEDFGLSTRLSHISDKTLAFLASDKGDSSFYLYDLIMNLQGMGSGLEFNHLGTKEKMMVMDRYLFLLDRIRFEYMKRLGWLDRYAGEGFTLVELVLEFDQLAPAMHAECPVLREDHPDYTRFREMKSFEKEGFIRKLLFSALKEMETHSTI